MKFNLTDEEAMSQILDVQADVEEKSGIMDHIVNDIIQPYCRDLDNYVLDKHI